MVNNVANNGPIDLNFFWEQYKHFATEWCLDEVSTYFINKTTAQPH